MAQILEHGVLNEVSLVEEFNKPAGLALATQTGASTLIFFGLADKYSCAKLLEQHGLSAGDVASIGTLIGDKGNNKFDFLYGEPQATELAGYSITEIGLNLMIARLQVLLLSSGMLNNASIEKRR